MIRSARAYLLVDHPKRVAKETAVALAASWEGEAGRSKLLGLAVVTAADTAAVTWIPANHLDDPAVSDALGHAAVQAHDVKALMRTLLAHEPPIDLAGLALDTAIAGMEDGMAETFDQLDELLIALGAGSA